MERYFLVEWTGNLFVKKGYCINVVLGNVNLSHRYINFFSMATLIPLVFFFLYSQVGGTAIAFIIRYHLVRFFYDVKEH